jgi:hypothetical protein
MRKAGFFVAGALAVAMYLAKNSGQGSSANTTPATDPAPPVIAAQPPPLDPATAPPPVQPEAQPAEASPPDTTSPPTGIPASAEPPAPVPSPGPSADPLNQPPPENEAGGPTTTLTTLGLPMRADRDGGVNGCHHGELLLKGNSLNFTCPSSDSKNVTVSTDQIRCVQPKGVKLVSNQEFHFDLEGMNPDETTSVFLNWLSPFGIPLCKTPE